MLLKCLLLILPLAVLAQLGDQGTGQGTDLGGTGTGVGLGGVTPPIVPDYGGGAGADAGLGGAGGNGGLGTGDGVVNGGMGGNGGLGGVGGPDYTTFSSGQPGPGGNGMGLGNTNNQYGGTGSEQQPGDSSEEEGSGDDQYTTDAGFGSGGLGLLKSTGQRWTVTILSCLLAIAVIALVAFFIVKRRRAGTEAPATP